MRTFGRCSRPWLTTAQTVEEGARSRRRNGGHWHNDFAEAELESVIERIQGSGDGIGPARR